MAESNSTDAIEFALMCDLAEIEIGRREKRAMCDFCRRPQEVCWCKDIRLEKLNVKSKVVLLQHPNEERRCLRTAPILEALLNERNFAVLKGKKFNVTRFPELEELSEDPNSLLLFPGDNAVPIDSLPPVGEGQNYYNILILDGTWQQAKSIFHRNPCLKKIKQVCVRSKGASEYIIRTQPTQDSLSTVETAAIALAAVERSPDVYHALVEPLRRICEYQIQHGAVEHHSKEVLIESGNYRKPLGKRTYKKLRKVDAPNRPEVGFKQWLENYDQKQSGLTEEIPDL